MQLRENSRKLRQTQTYTLLSLAGPAILEQLLLTAATYVDTAMIGTLGATATAAVAVNSSTIFLITGLLVAVGVGYSVQVAHSLGRGDTAYAAAVSRQALVGALVIGAVFMALLGGLSAQIPKWLGAEDSILNDAGKYLLYYSMGLPLQTCLAVFSAVLRCAGDTKTPLLFNAGANLINVILNFLFIFPAREITIWGEKIHVWGAGLGVAGAAMGTALSAGIMGLSLVLIIFIKKSPVQMCLGESFYPDGRIIRRAVALGLPVVLERITLSAGQLIMTRLVTSLGNLALAANHVAVTAEGISYLPAQGISFAATALVGQAVGGRDPKRARKYSNISGVVGAIAGGVGGLLLFCFARPLSGVFTPDPQVMALAADMLRIVAISEPFFGLSIVLSGVLRGTGDSRSPFFIVLLGMWGVRILMAPALLYAAGLGLSAVWIAMVADLTVRGILCGVKVKRLDYSFICNTRDMP